jgi:eukaryotic-like serine/threonine-protein kinase
MLNEIRHLYEFGSFRLDSAKRRLVREGKNLALPPKTFDLLLLLVEGRDRVLTKKELMGALWPDTFVEEANLSFQISALRKVLGASGAEWIETVPRVGYRFTCEVATVDVNLHPETDVQVPSEQQSTLSTSAHGDPDSDRELLGASGPLSPQPQRGTTSRIRRLRYWILAVPISLAAVVFVWKRVSETPSAEPVVRFQVAPPEGVRIGDIDSVSISPDGKQLVFIGAGPDTRRQLWIRALSSLTAKELPGTELAEAAFWSPDSRTLAFFAAGKLKRLDLQSGSVLVICNSPVGRSSGSWNRDGDILFESSMTQEIYRVNAKGGEPRRLTKLSMSNRETRHSAPQLLPDGQHFIYFVESERAENTGIYVASLDWKGGKLLVNTSTNAVYARLAGGATYLLFTRGSDLIAQKFDLKKLELVGAPFTLVPHVFIEVVAGIARALVSASQNGVLAYRTRTPARSTELAWFDRQGRRLGTVGEPRDYSNPSLSPDEKKLMVSVADPQIETRDLWLFDLSRGASSRFTFDPDDEDQAVWSPDGSRVAFDVLHNSLLDLYQKPVAGTSKPQLLLHSNDSTAIRDWSPDGRFILFSIGNNVWFWPTTGEAKSGPYSMETPKVSPNGNWVAYGSDTSGRSEVYVQSFPRAEGKWQVSTTGGTEPLWRRDGKELFFIRGDTLMAMDVKTDMPAFEFGVPKPLFEVHLEARERRRYQVAANGQRFLINVPVESSPINVEVNWTVGVAP